MKVAAVVTPGRLGVVERDAPASGRGELVLRVDRVGICGSDLHYLPKAPLGGGDRARVHRHDRRGRRGRLARAHRAARLHDTVYRLRPLRGLSRRRSNPLRRGADARRRARALGMATVAVSDPVAGRRELARRLGATPAIDPTANEPTAVMCEACGAGPDVVIECIGRPGRLDLATAACRRGGRVILGGMVLKRESFDPMPPFMKGLRVEFVIQYAQRHFVHTVAMLEQGRIDPRPMITAEITLDELPAMMAALRRPNDQCKVLVAPRREHIR